MSGPSDRFALSGVVHLIQPWGAPARDLESLRAGLAAAPDDVLFRHAVQHRLRDPAAGELPPDDLSAWIGGVLQDPETAERVAFAVLGAPDSPGGLRRAVLDVLDPSTASRRRAHAAPPEGEFTFLAAVPVAFDTGVDVGDGAELVEALAVLDPSVWFWHLVEEPWRSAGLAPILAWLESRADARLARGLRGIASEGLPLDRARRRALRAGRRRGIGRRLVDAATAPPADRRAAGREVVARWIRRGSDPAGA